MRVAGYFARIAQVSLLLSVGASGCADSNASGPSASSPSPSIDMTTSAHVTTTTSTPTADDQSAVAGVPGSMQASPSMASSAAAEPINPVDAALTDGQIAMIASDVDRAEIAAGKLALTHARSVQVRQFAQHMVTEHTKVDTKLLALARAQNIPLTDSTVSAKLTRENDAQKSSLAGLSGTDFDRAYIDAQLKGHEDVLDMLDARQIPTAQNGALKATLETTRAKVLMHIHMAKEARAALGN